MEDKIKELEEYFDIIDCSDPQACCVHHENTRGPLMESLVLLINQEREKAVRGFVEWEDSQFGGDREASERLVEQYLKEGK